MKKILSRKYIKFSIKTVIIFLIIILNISCIFGASDPTLVTRLNSAMKKILKYLEKLAVPIAGVAIASGVIMRKLSFGDEEKMLKGKKVIINAIVGYGIIISIDLIIKFVDAIL